MNYDIVKDGKKVGTLNMEDAIPIPPEPGPEPTPDGDVTITGMAGRKEISMTSIGSLTGGFGKLKWSTQDFIVFNDYGQGLQSAVSFDGLGEKCNPTEHGGSINYPGTSMSKLLERKAVGNTLMSKTQMAYWIPVDGKALSDVILTKKVQIGTEWTDHAIQHDLVFSVPEDKQQAQFEALTGYMPSQFSDYWGYNPQTHDLEAPEDNFPIVLSTPDGQYAMGCFSPDKGAIYDSFTSAQLGQDMVKWNVVFRKGNTPKGDYVFKVFVIVGTLENVRVSMIQLHDAFKDEVIPGGDIPPRLNGQFFMSGLKTAKGFYLGTYRPAKLYLYDTSYHELLSLPTESVYMLHETPSDVIFTTECPAGIGRVSDGKWIQLRPEPNSLAFDIWPYKGGLIVHTASNSNRMDIRTYRADINGNKWTAYKDHSGWYMPCYCTDGNTYWIAGRKRNIPCIEREDGVQVLYDQSYKDNEINYLSVKDGLFTLGMNCIGPMVPDGTGPRNAYINYFDGQNDIAGIDCNPPWIMNIKTTPQGRFAIASIWNEPNYPNPELVFSPTGRRPWSKIADISFPSVQTIEVKDGIVYSYGGKKDEYGAVDKTMVTG
jgi:hypothetical protein